jgi:hypothetical protein
MEKKDTEGPHMTLHDSIRAKIAYYNYVSNDILALRNRILWTQVKGDLDCMRKNLGYWRNRI